MNIMRATIVALYGFANVTIVVGLIYFHMGAASADLSNRIRDALILFVYRKLIAATLLSISSHGLILSYITKFLALFLGGESRHNLTIRRHLRLMRLLS